MKMENCKPATSQKPQNNFLNDINEKKIKDSSSKYLEHFWPNSFNEFIFTNSLV